MHSSSLTTHPSRIRKTHTSTICTAHAHLRKINNRSSLPTSINSSCSSVWTWHCLTTSKGTEAHSASKAWASLGTPRPASMVLLDKTPQIRATGGMDRQSPSLEPIWRRRQTHNLQMHPSIPALLPRSRAQGLLRLPVHPTASTRPPRRRSNPRDALRLCFRRTRHPRNPPRILPLRHGCIPHTKPSYPHQHTLPKQPSRISCTKLGLSFALYFVMTAISFHRSFAEASQCTRLQSMFVSLHSKQACLMFLLDCVTSSLYIFLPHSNV